MKIRVIDRKYSGLGFVEALVALMVAGVVSLVLMQISAGTLRALHQLDVQDAIAKHAVSTAVDLQKIATQDRFSDSKQFAGLILDNCYGVEIAEDGEVIIGVNPVNRDSRTSYSSKYLVKDTDESDTEYFRIFCVKVIESNRALVEIIVGSNRMAGIVTSDNDVKDYSYIAIILR